MITFLVVVLAVSLGIALAALDEPAAHGATRDAPQADDAPIGSPHAVFGPPAPFTAAASSP
ncbi:hypothetical protein GCM10020358_71820 [Amorphoplanes nipponensis]|uniref:Uncharacterized protein n=1 Tax=Actinoplanes nipponensis TaxID=135950 RepID=A0A919MRK1_9ACTN|nr:hypothetical protein [Actinoplanes nipponensis]GIE47030.1 hypothetical protein Ani05nite_05640 [Actinoplanes nipponensis]